MNKDFNLWLLAPSYFVSITDIICVVDDVLLYNEHIQPLPVKSLLDNNIISNKLINVKLLYKKLKQMAPLLSIMSS